VDLQADKIMYVLRELYQAQPLNTKTACSMQVCKAVPYRYLLLQRVRLSNNSEMAGL